MSEETAKSERRSLQRLALAAGLCGAAAVLWTHRRYFTVRAVRTGGTPEYPEIVPQVVPFPLQRVREAVLEVSRALPGWEQIAAEERDLRGFIGGYSCRRRNVAIHLEPVYEGKMTKVSITSSCEGKLPDLGANARTVRDFQQRLRAVLSAEGGAREQ